MKRTTCMVAAVILAAAPALAGLSGSFQAKYKGSSFGNPGNINIKVHAPTGTNQVFAWQSNFQEMTNVNGDANKLSDPLRGFCIDLEDNVNTNSTHTWQLVDLAQAPDGQHTMGTERANRIAELWGRHHSSVVDGASAAAFQIAVWEIIYESQAGVPAHGTYDVSDANSDFYVSNIKKTNGATLIATANAWLNSIDGTGPKALLGGFTNANVQDFVAPIIPAPAAGVLGLIGMGVVGWIKRRN